MPKIDQKSQNICLNIFSESRTRKIIFTIPKSALQQENLFVLIYNTFNLFTFRKTNKNNNI